MSFYLFYFYYFLQFTYLLFIYNDWKSLISFNKVAMHYEYVKIFLVYKYRLYFNI